MAMRAMSCALGRWTVTGKTLPLWERGNWSHPDAEYPLSLGAYLYPYLCNYRGTPLSGSAEQATEVASRGPAADCPPARAVPASAEADAQP